MSNNTTKARHRAAGRPSMWTKREGTSRVKLFIGSLGLMLSATFLQACETPGEAIPQDPSATAKPVSGKAQPAVKISSCDRVREAFLTGTLADQTKALKALKADKTADGTSREYAGYWLGRDKKDPDLREMDQTLIVSTCH